MTAVTEQVTDQVREIVLAARRAGEPMPGRPTLKRLTGATDYKVRKALEELSPELGLAGDSPAQTTASGDVDDSPTDSLAPPGDEHIGEQSPERRVPSLALATAKTMAPQTLATAPPAQEPPAQPALAPARPPARPPALAPASPAKGASGGRLVAWTGFVFGSVMSVAANVLATWLPAAHEQRGWSPGIPVQVGAAVWPIALLIAVEVLSRIKWPSGFLWSLVRYGGAGTVAIASALISYEHLRAVLVAWNYGAIPAAVGPLVLDGLMVVAGFGLLSMSDRP